MVPGTESKLGRLHQAWRVSIVIALATGLFYLINLIGPTRGALGEALLTPFRVAFLASWALLIVAFIAEKRRPRFDASDVLVAVAVVFFLVRGLLLPETLSITLNWVATGAGVFLLVKHGIRSTADVRLVVLTLAAAVVAVSLAGVIEYTFKQNPLFGMVQVKMIGADARIDASRQFYRIRSLIGHPDFVGAFLIGGAPLVMLAFWRRRLLLMAAMLLLAAALLFTFTRGAWLIAFLVLLPILVYRARYWLVRNAKWVAPVLIIAVVFVAVDYARRQEVTARLGSRIVENGLAWSGGKDGICQVASGEADGLLPYNKFVYFNVDDAFFHNQHGAVTVIIHYFDRGTGAIHIDYDSWNSGGGDGGAYTQSDRINKTNTHQWTSAAFYLTDARFDNRENWGTDFRIVDDDSMFVVDQVTVQKGKMKLPTLIAQQWQSREGSLWQRLDLYPRAWAVVMANPWGVGPFNSPGTNHHAVDSLPLTWLMEYGWLSLALLGGLLLIGIMEGIQVLKHKTGVAVVLYLSLLVLLLNGSYVMILDDKSSQVLIGCLAALYALVRPWRRGGAHIDVSIRDCMF